MSANFVMAVTDKFKTCASTGTGYFTAPHLGGALPPPWDRNPWKSVSVRP